MDGREVFLASVVVVQAGLDDLTAAAEVVEVVVPLAAAVVVKVLMTALVGILQLVEVVEGVFIEHHMLHIAVETVDIMVMVMFPFSMIWQIQQLRA